VALDPEDVLIFFLDGSVVPRCSRYQIFFGFVFRNQIQDCMLAFLETASVFAVAVDAAVAVEIAVAEEAAAAVDDAVVVEAAAAVENALLP
jgi:hypothetical protein